SRDAVLLRLVSFHQTAGTEVLQYRDRFRHRTFEAPHQLRRFEITTSCELFVSNTRVRLAADPGDDPLPDIPAEVQHQIADGVLMIAVPHPDLLVSKLSYTLLNPGKELLEFPDGKVQEDTPDCGFQAIAPRPTSSPKLISLCS